MDLKMNADRFTGFADVYENARPAMPMYPVNIICRYLGKKPETVMDLGCGTGLSTIAWENVCDHVIGVEPSPDMIAIAKKKENDKISFLNCYSHDINVTDSSADVAVCSQSFHWMEPVSTLKEVNRILKDGGVFATVDCDWPPVSFWQADKAYDELYKKVKKIEAETEGINDSFIHYSKDNHLQNIKNSGYFRYAREVLFSNTEQCTAQRFVNIILSQGSLQTILKQRPELISDDIEKFKNKIFSLWGDMEIEIDFSYRMRIGVK